MRAARPVLALALVASLSVAGVASAVTRPKPKPVKPVCNLIADPTGDASPQYLLNGAPTVGPSDDALDVVSADVASDAGTFTAVLRVKNLSAATPSQYTGRGYYMTFALKGAANTMFVAGMVDPSATVFQYGDLEALQGQTNYTPKGSATGVFDTAKNEVRISVPVSALSGFGKVTPGSKVSGLDAQTFALIGTPQAAPSSLAISSLNNADDAQTTKPYIAGTPSCVKPGK